MPETLSPDIRTGYDTQTAFDMRLDTFNRMNEVFNRPSKGFGIDYFEPRSGLASPPTTNAPAIPPMNFEDALTSNDPKVRDLALRSLERDAYSNPYGRLNVGTEFRTPVDRNVSKFIDDKYGFDMFSDNEDFYYRNSYLDDGWFMRAMKNVLWRFPSRVVVGATTKFVEGMGYLGSMVTNGVVHGFGLAGKEASYWEDVADNALSKTMKNMDENFRDYVVPVYKQAGFDEKGFFSQLGNYAFWNDSFADGVAFMASIFIPAGIASKTGLLAKGASLGAGIAADAGAAARIGGGLRAALRGATGGSTYGEAGLSIFNTANEAAFQATAQYTETKRHLLDARARGENEYTDREIQELSGKAASSSYLWNFPALMISNAWEMKNVIKPLAGRKGNAGVNTNRVILEDTGKLGFKQYKSAALGKIAGSYPVKVASKYVPIAAKGTLIEGFWEENIQSAIDRAGRGEYTRFGDNTDSAGVLEKANGGFFGILEQFAKQTVDALKGDDREVSLSIGIGALLGGGAGTVGSKFGRRIVPGEYTTDKDGKQVPRTSFFIGERRQAQKALNLVFMETNNAYNNFLSIQDVRNPDGTVDEKKLAAKVAAFESFAAKQEILNDLQTKKVYKPEELQMLQNNLMNDYVRGLAKVGKIDDAVKRMQDLANRDVDSKSEQFISNPLEIAKYLENVAKIYTEEQTKPDHVSSKYSPAEMEQVNTAIKDRSFDLRAARLAMDPVLKDYEKQVNDRLGDILGFLQNEQKLPQGEYIEEGLKRTRARDYIEAMAKREVYQSLLDKDAPEFLKDYHKSKIKEADDAIAAYNKELGDNAPEIKDGNVQFKDKVIDFKSKLLKQLLEAYKSAYSDLADVEFMQQHNEHIAKSITDPVNGLANWEDYLEYVKRAIEKKNIPTETTTETTPVTGTKPTIPLQAIADKVAKGEILTPEELEVYEKNKREVDRLAKRPPKPTDTQTDEDEKDEDVEDTEDKDILTEEDKGVKEQTDRIDPDNPLSWLTPNKSSTDDTIILNDESEQLKDVPYDELRKLVIREMMADVNDFNSKYKVFMVKDVYPQIYRAPANNHNKDEVVPSGEVIIIEKADGTIATVKDFFGNKYKDMVDLPMVFSAEIDIFRNYLVPERASIYARKMKVDIKEANESYQKDNDKNRAAREMIKQNPAEKIQLEIIAATDGILPTTKNVVTVKQRFGENFTLSVKTKESAKYRKGSIVATIGKVSFPVGTMRVRGSTELANIQKVLEMSFDTKEEARQVRNNYLNVMFHTDKTLARFRVKKEGEKYKIIFEKIDDKDKNLPPEKRQKALKQSTAYGELRFNVSKKALSEGMNMYDATTKQFTHITAEEYQEFVKGKAVTSLKKTVDKDGNLYMKPVNAYFSFNISDQRLESLQSKEEKQQKHYETISASIEQAAQDGTINTATTKDDLKTYLKNKFISVEQFNKLNARVDEIAKEQKKVKPTIKTPPATETSVKTDQQEDDEEAAFKKKKSAEKAKNKKKADVGETIGNTTGKTDQAPYTVEYDGRNYFLNPDNGFITTQLVFGQTVKNFVMNKNDKDYVPILEKMAKTFPFRKNDDGTIAGILVTQLESEESGIITAYGIPTPDGDIFVDSTNKVITSKDAEGIEVSSVPFVRDLLSDKGKTQLEEFLSRNC